MGYVRKVSKEEWNIHTANVYKNFVNQIEDLIK